MEKYQNILRDHTERNFAAKKMNTSLMMFPVRLETKIMQKEYDSVSEPDKSLYVFRALGDVLREYINSAKDKDFGKVTKAIRNLKCEMEKADVFYKEDKTMLLTITDNLYNAFHTVELQDEFLPVIESLKDVTCTSSLSDKASTRFFDEMEKMARLAYETFMYPDYDGKRRRTQPDRYSIEARYAKALHHARRIYNWINQAQKQAESIKKGMVFVNQMARYEKQIAKFNAVVHQNEECIKGAERLYWHYELEPPTVEEGTAAYKNYTKAKDALITFCKNKLYPKMVEMDNGGWSRINNTLLEKRVNGANKLDALVRYTSVVAKYMTQEILLIKYLFNTDEPYRKAIKKEFKKRCKAIPGLVKLTYFNYNAERDLVKKLMSDMINGCCGYFSCEVPKTEIDNCLVVHKGRFNKRKSKKSLCVRIYPDVVALTQVAKQLSRAEYLVGKDFWLKYIFNGQKKVSRGSTEIDDYKHSLWLSVCDLYPAHRAAFIIKQTFPKDTYKVMCRKAKVFHDENLTMDDFMKEIDENFVNSFPTTYVDNGEEVFTVPVTDLLPDRFVLRAEVNVSKGSKKTMARYGHRLPSQLQVGLNLNDLEDATQVKDEGQTTAQLYLNGNLRWMTDYEEAEKMGMAISLPLDAMKYERGKNKARFLRLKKKNLRITKRLALLEKQKETKQDNTVAAENTSKTVKTIPNRVRGIKLVRPILNSAGTSNGTTDTTADTTTKTATKTTSVPRCSSIMFERRKKLLEQLRQSRSSERVARSFSFSSIYVYGINDASTDECSMILQDLMTSHLYSGKAMDIISFETPSNILDDSDTEYAFDSSEVKQRERFKHQAHNCVYPHKPEPGNDLDILDRLFCLKESVLGNVDVPKQGGTAEVELGRRVNRLMIEYLTDRKLSPAINPLIAAIKATPEIYDFVSNDVLPRGPFPMIRISDQPYGILPVCDFRYLKVRHPLNIIQKILTVLTVHWNNILSNNIVNCYGKDDGKSKDTVTTKDYLDILNSTPRSTAFYKRTTVKNTSVIKSEFFRGEESAKPLTELFAIAKELKLVESKDELKAIIPNYDFVPVIDLLSEKDSYGNAIENNVTKLVEGLDIQNIVAKIKKQIETENKTNTNGLELCVDKKVIEKHIIEFFDLFNYRLDAWLMGMLNNKLRKRMEKGRHRVAIGSFGWLFNLHEDDKAEQSYNEYVLAPSVNQAITAAVLRSSYNNSMKNGDKNYDMSVNLSSERVRSAIRIIEGIQNGLSIGCILGADLERLIHEAYKTPFNGETLEMDVCIYPLRKAYPLSDSNSEDNISVINGAKLLEEYRSVKNKTADNIDLYLCNWLKLLGLFKGQVNADKKCRYLLELIDQIDDEYDALTDVVLSESVYKLVLGNRDASDALARALDEMKNIPMPDVVNIPITSAQIDNYMVAMLDVDADSSNTSTVLANCEPKVESWITDMVGPMSNIFVNFVSNNSQGETVYNPVSLDDLHISASEFVYLSADDAAFKKFISVLNWRNGNDYAETDADAVVIDSIDEAHSLAEMNVVADEIRKLLSASHALHNEELVKETGLENLSVTNDMSSVYYNLEGYMNRMLKEMGEIIEAQAGFLNTEAPNYDINVMDDTITNKIIDFLVDSYRIGQVTALDEIEPDLIIGSRTMIEDINKWKDIVSKQHALLQKLKSVHEDFSKKLESAKQSIAEAGNPDYTVFVSAVQKILVNGFKLIPVFQPDTNVPLDDLKKQVEVRHFNNIDSIGVESTIGEIAQVEKPVMHFHQMRMFQKCNDLDVPRVLPMQITSNNRQVPGDEWLGTQVSSEDAVTDAFTYIVMNPERIAKAIDMKQPKLAGLVIDHWVDRIPYKEQTAAVTFAYDQPDAEAPQTILLAVSTKDGEKSGWNEKMLVNSLKSAIHMVKTRTVSPDHISRDAWTSGIFPLLEYKSNDSNK